MGNKACPYPTHGSQASSSVHCVLLLYIHPQKRITKRREGEYKTVSSTMSLITPNSFTHIPEGPSTDKPPVTIFFITGNPGLIGYYHTFLSLLSSKLAACTPDTRFQVYGHSLSGFEIDDSTFGSTSDAPKAELRPEADARNDYYDVEGQISFVQRRLDEFLSIHGGSGQAGKRQKVILMGHSLGTYIAMEVLRRHRERQKAAAAISATADVDFDIIGGVMLFPTVVDIAKSPSGRKLKVRVVDYNHV